RPLAVKLAPVITTLEPAEPNPGENPDNVGGTTKLLPEVTNPPGEVIRSGPVTTPPGTVTKMLLGGAPTARDGTALTVNGPFVPLNSTSVASRILVPKIATFVPWRPIEGMNFVIKGGPKKFEVVVKSKAAPND